MIDAIGVGWFSTISAAFLVCSAAGVWLTADYGGRWREAIDQKIEEKREQKTQETEVKQNEKS